LNDGLYYNKKSFQYVYCCQKTNMSDIYLYLFIIKTSDKLEFKEDIWE